MPPVPCGPVRHLLSTSPPRFVDAPGTTGIDNDVVIDVAGLLAAEGRPPPPNRPWVMVNMVASLDGAVVASDGRSGQLSGPADRLVFKALRGLADIVLAGARTIRVEDYGAPKLSPEVQAARTASGRTPLPRMATVSSSLRLDPTARLFRETPSDQRPIVLTTTRALQAVSGSAASDQAGPHAALLHEVAELRACGDETVDWASALQQFRRDGVHVLLLEGGPTVNAQLIFADLVDEFCLTLSPTLVGTPDSSAVTPAPNITLRRLSLDRVLEEDGFLFLRYLRT
jgi:riboflavin biosynthesis pyrimidine reductase